MVVTVNVRAVLEPGEELGAAPPAAAPAPPGVAPALLAGADVATISTH
jgi:hypothetical protein